VKAGVNLDECPDGAVGGMIVAAAAFGNGRLSRSDDQDWRRVIGFAGVGLRFDQSRP
jgi:hypothetical protein